MNSVKIEQLSIAIFTTCSVIYPGKFVAEFQALPLQHQQKRLELIKRFIAECGDETAVKKAIEEIENGCNSAFLERFPSPVDWKKLFAKYSAKSNSDGETLEEMDAPKPTPEQQDDLKVMLQNNPRYWVDIHAAKTAGEKIKISWLALHPGCPMPGIIAKLARKIEEPHAANEIKRDGFSSVKQFERGA